MLPPASTWPANQVTRPVYRQIADGRLHHRAAAAGLQVREIDDVEDTGDEPSGQDEGRLRYSTRRLNLVRTQRLSAALRADEVERQRMSRELYGDLGQSLMALKLDMHCLQQSLVVTGSVLPDEHLARMQGELDHLIARTRAIASQLRPPMLDDLGLFAAVNWLADSLKKRSGIASTVECKGRNPQPDDAATSTAYRVVEECLSNAERHAKATHVQIALWHTLQQIVVVVRDNGVGLPPDAAHRPGCFGLAAIHDRVLSLGGTLTISGAESRGAVIHATIPVGDLTHQATRS